jgi:hypothetical protein
MPGSYILSLKLFLPEIAIKMDISQHIEINPNILTDKPVIKGTRINS